MTGITYNHHVNTPVMWRCKYFADGWISFTSEEGAKRYQADTGCLMQPLYLRHAQWAAMRQALELIQKQVIERGGFTIERGSGAMTVIANALSTANGDEGR